MRSFRFRFRFRFIKHCSPSKKCLQIRRSTSRGTFSWVKHSRHGIIIIFRSIHIKLRIHLTYSLEKWVQIVRSKLVGSLTIGKMMNFRPFSRGKDSRQKVVSHLLLLALIGGIFSVFLVFSRPISFLRLGQLPRVLFRGCRVFHVAVMILRLELGVHVGSHNQYYFQGTSVRVAEMILKENILT